MLVKPILASAGAESLVSLLCRTPNSLFITLTSFALVSSVVPVLELGSCESPGESGLAVSSLFCLFVDNHKGLLGSL